MRETPCTPSSVAAPTPRVARVLAHLASRNVLGLCLFDEDGLVSEQVGAGTGFLPLPGQSVDDHPFFIGLAEALGRLKDGGGGIELPSLGQADRPGERFDLAIVWIAQERCFAALASPAAGRLEIEFAAAQTSRENRLLLEKVREQQEHIVAQNELMRVFITHVPAAVAMLDGQLNYLMLSDRWQQDFKVDAAVLRGRPFGNGLPPDLGIRWPQALRRGAGGKAQGIEKVVDASGAPEWYRWEQQTYPAVAQQERGTLVFSENITRSVEQTGRLRAQSAKLEQLNRQLRQFSLAVSHDLRAPIRQVRAFASILAEAHASQLDAEGAEFVALISQCAGRMLAMIEALLTFSRVSQMRLQWSTLPVQHLVEAACANLAADIAASGATMTCATPLEIQGDAALMTMVFQNLIDNALKYGGRNVAMEIAAKVEGDALLLQFSDSGPGIPAQLQAKAFEMFQRLGAGQHHAGAGVGLALCRRIVELHGGTLEIDGEYGGGLRFNLMLPLVQD